MGLKPWLMNNLLGWRIDPSARIGLSYIDVDHLRMGRRSRVGHLNMVRNIDDVLFDEASKIGNLNWISGVRSIESKLFSHQAGRRPRLELGPHASMTSRHLIDCSDAVIIGGFTTIAGARSQIITHGIDVKTNRQTTGAIEIGRYCYVGTASVILKGARLPDCCVLAAGSVLSKNYDDPYVVYGGVPARPIKPLDPDSHFFKREIGVVA